MNKGNMRSTAGKKGISITLDEDVLEWLKEIAVEESLSISYLVNRFCVIAAEALRERVAFPDKKQISNNVKRRGLG